MIGAAVVNWGFRLVRRGGSLVAVRGLLTRRHTELEIDRIRGSTRLRGPAMRLVQAARVNALVTGLADAPGGAAAPARPPRRGLALARRLVDDPGPLVRHPPAARRRRIVRAIGAGCWSRRGRGATVADGWWWCWPPGSG